MKKVLLVQLAETRPQGMHDVFPAGIMYISASMKQAGLSVFILNLILEEGDLETLLRDKIEKHQIDVVALGGLVVNHREMKSVISLAKKIKPEVVTIIGGGLVTYTPEDAMNLIPEADYGVIGEGEITDVELVNALSEGSDISKVAGIIYRDGETLRCTEERPLIADLNALPFPDYEGFQYLDMVKKFTASDVVAVGIVGSRGCPFSCTFCSESVSHSYRQRGLASIFAEIDFVIERFGGNHFTLMDELFAHDVKRVDEFCKEIKKRQVGWEVALRVGPNITLELLEKMKDSGCDQIQYGLESADDTILESMNKKITVKELERVLTCSKEANISINGNFIFGDAKETVETMENTFRWVYDHADLVSRAAFSPIRLFPGSTLYRNAVAEGKIKDTVAFIQSDIPLTNVSSMTEDEYYKMVYDDIPAFSAKFRRKVLMEQGKDVTLSILGQQGYSLQCGCEHCQAQIEDSVKGDELQLWHKSCSVCGHNNEFPLNIQYFISFEQKLSQLISLPTTGIWGVGGIFFNFFENNAYIKEHQVNVFDSNPQKQSKGVLNQKVFSPEKIVEMGIETLILTVDDTLIAYLKQYAKTHFSTVKNVIWIYEINKLGE